jgi:lipopolysaccharide export LptBFGC system permease protein LptF
VLIPVIGFSLLLTILLGAMSLKVAPAAVGRMLELRSEALRAGQFAPVTAGKFRMFGGGSIEVYAQGAARDGTLERVFVERDRRGQLEIALAQRATHVYAEGGDLQVITPYDGERFEGIPGERRFRIVRFARTPSRRLPALSGGAMASRARPLARCCGRRLRNRWPNSTGVSHFPSWHWCWPGSPCRWRACGHARDATRASATPC